MSPVILIVDDGARVLRALARMMRAQGWSVAEASTEAEACELIAAGELDAVLTDLHLGEGSGRVVAEAARMRRIPCITMTGSSEDADLRKPFEIEALSEALEAALLR
jgi:CheY-like chemotaxis protein